MSAITFEQVKHLASLALIEMTDEELTAMASELDIIVASVETMSQKATADIPATSHPIPLENVFREDVPVPTLTQEEALPGAPDAQDGKFRVPFNPFHAAHRQGGYTEGNAWQYTWLVPHDVHGLVNLFPSESSFVNKLDSLFIVEGDLGEDASPDISGLIGQYAHGNEPSHHILYMYNYVGQPWKAARLLRRTMDEMYTDRFDGLSGNEDVGQMSAWYILTAMGFYNVEPASTKYWFGSPLFDKVSIVVSKDGKMKFDINTVNNSKENKYIQKIILNGHEWDKPYIEYGDIVKGGKLTFYMGAHPAVWYNWETANEAAK